MEEVGRVVEISGDITKVELDRSKKCGHCGVKIMCHPGPEGKMCIEVINKIEARIGDRVKIEVSPSISILATFLLFVAPIIAFIVVFATVNILTKNENLAILSGFSGLILFFLLLIKINQKVAKNRRFHPVIKEIVSR